jgi:hypothetical protein
MDYHLPDEVMMDYGLLEVPMFSISLGFTQTVDILMALNSYDLSQLSNKSNTTVKMFISMLMEHATNNRPNNNLHNNSNG